MSRFLDDLERLCNELQYRYGADDPLCSEIKSELDARKLSSEQDVGQKKWTTPYNALIKDRDSEFMRPLLN